MSMETFNRRMNLTMIWWGVLVVPFVIAWAWIGYWWISLITAIPKLFIAHGIANQIIGERCDRCGRVCDPIPCSSCTHVPRDQREHHCFWCSVRHMGIWH